MKYLLLAYAYFEQLDWWFWSRVDDLDAYMRHRMNEYQCDIRQGATPMSIYDSLAIEVDKGKKLIITGKDQAEAQEFALKVIYRTLNLTRAEKLITTQPDYLPLTPDAYTVIHRL